MIANNKRSEVDLNQLKLYRTNPPLQEKDIHLVNQLSYPLPKRYIELLKISNGGRLEADAFDFYDEYLKHNNSNDVGSFCGLSGLEEGYNSIIYRNIEDNLPEFFPQSLLIFANPGGCGLVCFDYRNDPKSNNPPVVFWSSGADEGEDISFVAKDFDTFLSMLYSDDD